MKLFRKDHVHESQPYLGIERRRDEEQTMTNEPAHDNKNVCDQQKLGLACTSTSMARVLVYPFLDSPEAVKDICDQQRLRSDCASAQSDLSLRWSHQSYS